MIDQINQKELNIIILYYTLYCQPAKPLRSHGRPQEFSQGGGGASPKKAPLKTKKAPPQKKIKIVLSPFLGGSEACSPEKILTMVLPTTF